MLFRETENPFLHQLLCFWCLYFSFLGPTLVISSSCGSGQQLRGGNNSTECLFPFDSNLKNKNKNHHPVICFIIRQSGFWVCNKPPGQCGQQRNAHRNSWGELIVSLPVCSPKMSPEDTARSGCHCSCDKAPVKALMVSGALLDSSFEAPDKVKPDKSCPFMEY